MATRPTAAHRCAADYQKPLCAALDGFTLHAATRAGALDPTGRQKLLCYVLRPPIAHQRIELRPDGLVRGMSITRRDLLRNVGGLAAWAALPVGCGDAAAASVAQGSQLGSGETLAFLHGVASGDPLSDAVILWTRVTPRDPAAAIELEWQVATDLAFRELVASGRTTTDAARDFTAKVDAHGLAAGTLYYYRFLAADVSSPIGRTRTAPSGSVERLRFGVASCSSYAHGYFHGYRSLSERLDLDVVIHLGDYIYEYGTGEYGKIREYEPAHEIVTLK